MIDYDSLTGKQTMLILVADALLKCGFTSAEVGDRETLMRAKEHPAFKIWFYDFWLHHDVEGMMRDGPWFTRKDFE